MAYMFPTCKGYFFIILSAVHRESSRLTELHKLSRKDTDLHALRYVFPCIQLSPPEVTLRFVRDLQAICPYPKLVQPK